jgi:hypothetical protein
VITFKRSRDFNGTGKRVESEIRRLVAAEVMMGMDHILDAIEETPVYTGRTLINYRFSHGEKIEGVRPPVSRPTLPGKTSEMSLGSEPRRAANMDVVYQEFNAVKQQVRRDPYKPVFLVNNTPYFMEVELGSYKTSQGHDQRTPPGGMVRRAEHMLALTLGK